MDVKESGALVAYVRYLEARAQHGGAHAATQAAGDAYYAALDLLKPYGLARHVGRLALLATAPSPMQDQRFNAYLAGRFKEEDEAPPRG